MILHRRDGPVT